MWPKQLQLSLRGTWPTLLHNRKRKGCCAAFGFWKSVRALPGQDYKGKMCIAMRESLTEASRHQVQGRVIKWQHFCHLEKSPQSWQKKKGCVTGDTQPRAAPASCTNVSSPVTILPETLAMTKPFPNLDREKGSIPEVSHCYSKPLHFVIKQSLTGAEPNKFWIVVISDYINYKNPRNLLSPKLSCIRMNTAIKFLYLQVQFFF